MIEGHAQAREIVIDDSLSLVKYYDNYDVSLTWYQNTTICKQVDNVDTAYTLEKLRKMYHYLNGNGECYYIKIYEDNKEKLIGDISLYNGEIAIIICEEYQNKGIGKKAIQKILLRAKNIGIQEVKAHIYDFNEQSKKTFVKLGFKPISDHWYRYAIKNN